MAIEIARLKNIKHIVTHDNCSDGIASALILKHVLPDAKVTFCQYQTALHKTLPAEEGMAFVDFSPDITRVDEFLAAGAIVLDHHGGPAKEVTLAFAEKGLGAFADEKADPGVSGALLAFNHVWKPLAGATNSEFYGNNQMAVFKLAELAGIRDTWQKDDPLWREACASAEALRFWPWDHVEKNNTADGWQQMLKIGPILIDRNEKKLANILKGSYQYDSSKGRKVTIFEGLKPTSDAAELLGESNDLTTGLAFFTEKAADGSTQQVLVFSNRSRGSFNCRNYALAHGGGGHTKAAGFSRVLQPNDKQPFTLAKELLHRYERVEDQWAALTAEPDFDRRVKNGEVVPRDLYESLHT